MKFFARLFFVVAPIFLWLFCWGVSMEGATGCLRGARFARNFFQKNFNRSLPRSLPRSLYRSLPRMIKFSTRLGGGQFFFQNSGPGGCGLALQMFRVCVFPGASRPKMLQEFFQKFGKIREHAPDPTFIGRARGGLTYFGASMIYCFA